MKKYDHILFGGTGFIGAELAFRLRQVSDAVLCIGRSTDDELLRDISVEEIELANEGAVEKSVRPAKNFFILLGQNYPDFDKEKELEILRRMINSLNALDVSTRVFYFSSALVYGDTVEAASETAMPEPVDVYSQFKYEAEQLFQNTLDKKHQLRILRLANVYGSPKNKGFIGLLMRSVASETPFVLNGGGVQERDYVYIDDIVGAIMAIVENTEEVQCDIINIATGTSASLLQVVATFQDILGTPIRYSLNQVVPKEVQISRINNEKLENIYQYKIQYSPKEGLQKTWERYQLN